MAVVTGKEGKVLYKGVPVLHIQNWSANVNVDIRDHTSFTTGALQWRVTKPGLSGGAGSFSGFWDPSTGSTAQRDCMDAALAASTGSIILHGDKTGGTALTGNIFFSGLTVGSGVDADATADFPFTFNGPVTYSTST